MNKSEIEKLTKPVMGELVLIRGRGGLVGDMRIGDIVMKKEMDCGPIQHYNFYRIMEQKSCKVLLDRLCADKRHFLGGSYVECTVVETENFSSLLVDENTLYHDFKKFDENKLYPTAWTGYFDRCLEKQILE